MMDNFSFFFCILLLVLILSPIQFDFWCSIDGRLTESALSAFDLVLSVVICKTQKNIELSSRIWILVRFISPHCEFVTLLNFNLLTWIRYYFTLNNYVDDSLFLVLDSTVNDPPFLLILTYQNRLTFTLERKHDSIVYFF